MKVEKDGGDKSGAKADAAQSTADDDDAYVNLSDGGHFENLGLYELVRRKCDLIVIGDGEEVIHRVVDLVKRGKQEGWSRLTLLRHLAHVPGTYVPSGYTTHATVEGWQVPRAMLCRPALK